MTDADGRTGTVLRIGGQVIYRQHPILGIVACPADEDAYASWMRIWTTMLTEEQRQTWLTIQHKQAAGRRLVSIPNCGQVKPAPLGTYEASGSFSLPAGTFDCLLRALRRRPRKPQWRMKMRKAGAKRRARQ